MRPTNIIVDPRHFVAFQKLHQKPCTRAQVEEGPYDSRSTELAHSFNSSDNQSEFPKATDGITKQMLAISDTNNRPHDRTAEAMRGKWSTPRARYTTCLHHFEKSCHDEDDFCSDFAKGEPIWATFIAFSSTHQLLDCI